MITSNQIRKHEIEEFREELKNYATFNALNVDFYNAYQQSSLLVKYQHRANTRVIRVNDEPVLIIWCDFRRYYSKIRTFHPLKRLDKVIVPGQMSTIMDVFAKSMEATKDTRFEYAVAEDAQNRRTLRRMGFSEEKKVFKMSCSLNEVTPKEPPLLRPFRVEDIKERVDVQNDIFRSKYRIPINSTDILIEMSKSSFRSDLCFFFMKEGETVGYGQIVEQQGVATLVNFGLREKYRGAGLARRYLEALLWQAREKGFHRVELEVNDWNHRALELYRAHGFHEDLVLATYVYKKD